MKERDNQLLYKCYSNFSYTNVILIRMVISAGKNVSVAFSWRQG